MMANMLQVGGCRVEKQDAKMGPAANDSTDSTGRGRGWGKKKEKKKKKTKKEKCGQQAESSHHQSSAVLCNDALQSRFIDKMRK